MCLDREENRAREFGREREIERLEEGWGSEQINWLPSFIEID